MPIGFDNYRPNQGLLLDLQFRETTGTVTRDWSKVYHDPATLTGAPAWAVLGNDLSYLSFDPGNPDRVVILAADSTALNFTTAGFSGACWIYPDAYGNRYLMDKSSATAGWSFWVSGTSPYIGFTTYNAGPATQTTYGAASLELSAWQFVAFSRSGATARVYLNGEDATATPATHIDPATAAAIDFYIGTVVGAGAGWYDGRMWRPRVWNRVVSAAEFRALYAMERDLFGV
jgi:hypothetical protein